MDKIQIIPDHMNVYSLFEKFYVRGTMDGWNNFSKDMEIEMGRSSRSKSHDRKYEVAVADLKGNISFVKGATGLRYHDGAVSFYDADGKKHHTNLKYYAEEMADEPEEKEEKPAT